MLTTSLEGRQGAQILPNTAQQTTHMFLFGLKQNSSICFAHEYAKWAGLGGAVVSAPLGFSWGSLEAGGYNHLKLLIHSHACAWGGKTRCRGQAQLRCLTQLCLSACSHASLQHGSVRVAGTTLLPVMPAEPLLMGPLHLPATPSLVLGIGDSARCTEFNF